MWAIFTHQAARWPIRFSARAFANLGAVLGEQEKWREAIAALEKAIELEPTDCVGVNGLAWLLATARDPKLRDPGRAVSLAKRGIELHPNSGGHVNTLGIALCRTGDWQAAAATLAESMRLREGGDSFDWFFMAMAQWQLGNRDAAGQWYDKAVGWMEKNKPKDPELIRFRSEAAQLLGVNESK
jgi:tetratricopeptide (TPR) repeat protein